MSGPHESTGIQSEAQLSIGGRVKNALTPPIQASPDTYGAMVCFHPFTAGQDIETVNLGKCIVQRFFFWSLVRLKERPRFRRILRWLLTHHVWR